jgi:hypothetical protein
LLIIFWICNWTSFFEWLFRFETRDPSHLRKVSLAMAWVPSSQAVVQALLKLHGVSIVLDTPLSPFRVQGYASEILGPLPVIAGFLLIYILAVVWGGQVTEIVPQPYLVC